jgi:hypothetical protein
MKPFSLLLHYAFIYTFKRQTERQMAQDTHILDVPVLLPQAVCSYIKQAVICLNFIPPHFSTLL